MWFWSGRRQTWSLQIAVSGFARDLLLGQLASSFLGNEPWAVLEGDGAGVTSGENFGREVESYRKAERLKDRTSVV